MDPNQNQTQPVKKKRYRTKRKNFKHRTGIEEIVYIDNINRFRNERLTKSQRGNHSRKEFKKNRFKNKFKQEQMKNSMHNLKMKVQGKRIHKPLKHKIKKNVEECQSELEYEKLMLESQFKTWKKNMLKMKKKKGLNKDFYDFDEMIKVYEDKLAFDLEELKRKKCIQDAEINARNALRMNVSYPVLLAQEKIVLELKKINDEKRKEFDEITFKRRADILRRRQLSRERRVELEDAAWQSAKQEAAIQRFEERLKTAELMMLLEGDCDQPAEGTSQSVNECDFEDITSSDEEEEEEMDIIEGVRCYLAGETSQHVNQCRDEGILSKDEEEKKKMDYSERVSGNLTENTSEPVNECNIEGILSKNEEEKKKINSVEKVN